MGALVFLFDNITSPVICAFETPSPSRPLPGGRGSCLSADLIPRPSWVPDIPGLRAPHAQQSPGLRPARRSRSGRGEGGLGRAGCMWGRATLASHAPWLCAASTRLNLSSQGPGLCDGHNSRPPPWGCGEGQRVVAVSPSPSLPRLSAHLRCAVLQDAWQGPHGQTAPRPPPGLCPGAAEGSWVSGASFLHRLFCQAWKFQVIPARGVLSLRPTASFPKATHWPCAWHSVGTQ